MNVSPQLFALGFKRADKKRMKFYRNNIKVCHKQRREPPCYAVWAYQDSVTKEYNEFSCFRNLLTFVTDKLLDEQCQSR